MAEILVAEDERVVREGLRRMLTAEGFAVRLARSGGEALTKFREHRPDLVLLDVMMPGLGGFDVCRRIRAEDAMVPVIFLTGLDGEADEVRGMGLGADDYISKAAGDRAILARLRRALERAGAVAGRLEAETRTLRVGETVVDFASRLAHFPDGATEKLTGAELDILRALDADRARYFTCAELYAAMHGEGLVAEDATLRSQISRLKAKLRASGNLIRSERGAGYRLIP